ncbi:putative transcriptional regulatory protein [Lasiodiplodia hormozganensis]|uniref:Transcriptional regulatory protein n=1 Tax=Lasiodiplodia hormozganensis TaxID=869390 RepID=A0AA39Y2H3_9PEZI|nr:putative transcriptional regulatory protein [Lasiodiplodia hormozganensis]
MGSPMQIVEVGTLRTRENEESNFLGSSTGVYFVNTVRHAFKASKDPGAQSTDSPTLLDPEQEGPNPLEDFLLDEGSDDNPETPSALADFPVSTSCIPRGPSYDAAPPGIGRPPDPQISKKLLILYFKLWHPLFPFVHGPSFIREVECLYDSSKSSPSPPGSEPDRHRCCRAIIAQCIFNVAQAGMAKDYLPRHSRIESSQSLIFSLSSLATKQDLHSLQALFAAQLYFVCAGSFRSASAVGGMLNKSLFHAGLHRCPNRYSQLSDHERDIRKRIFWSAYILDRYLSQGLGIPLGFQDSDIDVCMPGRENHKSPSLRSHSSNASDGLSREHSSSSSAHGQTPPNHDSYGNDRPHYAITATRSDTPANPHEPAHKDVVLVGLVGYSQLTGRAIELFHKSIHVRSVDHSKILYITADIHSWYNSLPMKLTSADTVVFPRGEPSDETIPSFVPLFTVLYQQLLLLVNRPCLSLPTRSPEFLASMQTCIGASRTIIGALEMQLQLRQPFFLPELLSAGWMAGLILVFACQLNFYPVEKGFKEISQCLRLLRLMKDHWKSAMTYYQTLTRLFSELKHGHNAKLHPNPAKRSGSDDSDNSKRARFSRQSMFSEGYPHQPHHQPFHSMTSSRNLHNMPDIGSTMQQNRSHHSPDSSQRSSSQGSTPQQQFAQAFSASHFIFTPPGVEPQNFPADSIFSNQEYTGFSDAQLEDPLLDDPSVNEMDLFGSVAWGTLNGDYSYNGFTG